ncbi:MAG: c-type cytochrome [Anaerolineae bacterium]
MKRVLKWLGIVLGGLIGLVLILLAAVFVVSSSRLNRTYSLPQETIVVESGAASLANGERLVTVFCTGCHGPNLEGTVFLNDPMLGTIVASNLTAGQGGIGQSLTDLDFERAIRHAVGPDGKGLWVMPAAEYNHLSDQDVADIIAYIRSLPPVDNDPGESQLALGGRVLFTLGAVQLLTAEVIDHQQPHVEAVEPGVTLVYGEYLARTCTGCHGPDYAGGPSPEPGGWPVANLTPHEASGLGSWTEQDFITAMRTGVRPDGTELNPAMPWQAYAPLSDEDLSAIWLFLQSLPPVDSSGR